MQKDIELWARILQESEKPIEERCTPEELANEAMSIDDILAAHGEKQAEKDAAAAAQPKQQKDYIKEIIITNAEKPDAHTCYITYDIAWSNGKVEKNEVFEAQPTEWEFVRVKRMLRSRDDLNVAVALLQQSYDSNSPRQIKWTFLNKSTGIKTDNSQFSDLVNAKKILSRSEKIKSASTAGDTGDDTESWRAQENKRRAERAEHMNRVHGNSKVKYSYIPV